MSETYRIFGVEPSPYSVKVRSYFRYKRIPHEWVVRDRFAMEEFQKYAKLPLVPLVVTPEGVGLQDSTPILETLESRFPEPAVHPPDPIGAFVSVLLEEFGDEWGNKWMFHYRWAREVDQRSASERIARALDPTAQGDPLAALAAGVRERMVGRVGFVGSNAVTAPQIEDSFREAIGLLEAHLKARPYLFGARPAFADFGLWGQIYNAVADPTPCAIVRREAPSVEAWVERMLSPEAQGDFERWDTLEATLTPLLAGPVAELFLPWSRANAAAIDAGAEAFETPLRGRRWTQAPQKYHAKSLRELCRKYAEVAGHPGLDAVLEATGCLPLLRAA